MKILKNTRDLYEVFDLLINKKTGMSYGVVIFVEDPCDMQSKNRGLCDGCENPVRILIMADDDERGRLSCDCNAALSTREYDGIEGVLFCPKRLPEDCIVYVNLDNDGQVCWGEDENTIEH